MNQEEIDEVLRKHALFLKGKRGGRRAILAGADLRNANLSNADLYGASFREADLRGADLFGADLRFAILYKAKIYKQDADNAFLSQKQRNEIIICNLAND